MSRAELAEGVAVPVIDLMAFRTGDEAAKREAAARIDRACREVGFLSVVGHGVPDELVDDMVAVTSAFFDRPLDDKLRWTVAEKSANRGYAAVGTEALNQMRFEPKVQSIFLRVQIGSFDPANLAQTQVADLNPHLDYSVRSVPPSVREQSLGDPRGIVWHPADGRAFVSGMGSNNVIVTDASGARSARITVGQGPTGLALNAGGSRLYVLNRFDATISRMRSSVSGATAKSAKRAAKRAMRRMRTGSSRNASLT